MLLLPIYKSITASSLIDVLVLNAQSSTTNVQYAAPNIHDVNVQTATFKFRKLIIANHQGKRYIINRNNEF